MTTDQAPTPTPKKTTRKTSSGLNIVPQPMTLEQFKSYLKGIVFVGGAGWHPNKQQWEAIVEMIDSLIINKSPEQPAQQYFSPPQQYSLPQQSAFMPPMQSAIEPPQIGPSSPRNDDGSGPYRSDFI